MKLSLSIIGLPTLLNMSMPLAASTRATFCGVDTITAPEWNNKRKIFICPSSTQSEQFRDPSLIRNILFLLGLQSTISRKTVENHILIFYLLCGWFVPGRGECRRCRGACPPPARPRRTSRCRWSTYYRGETVSDLASRIFDKFLCVNLRNTKICDQFGMWWFGLKNIDL